MGTPVEHDDEAEAVIDHLNAEGGISIGTSPRVLVRGRYEGGGAVLHFRRRYEEGTYLHVDIKLGQEDLCHAVLDMCYPYSLSQSIEKPSSYEGLWRQTLQDPKSKCRTWMGIGYTTGVDTHYVDCAEHIFPSSVGYGWHSAQCAKKTSGEWNWCTGGFTCGKKAWMFQMTVFEMHDGQLGQEKLTVDLTYILFNKNEEGQQKVEILVAVDGEVKCSVRSVDKNDASLGHYDKDMLKKSASLFVRYRRDRVRATHPSFTPAYLTQIYQASTIVTGAPRIQGGEEETQAMMRCILQLLNSSEAVNLSLLVQVLHDQMSAEATRSLFIDELHAVLNGEGEVRSLAGVIAHLSPLPTEEVPYNSHESYPEILRLLLRLLISLKHAVGWGKWEVEMRRLFRTKFEMMTSWAPVERCRVCNVVNRGLAWQWHFPDFVVIQPQEDGQPLDLGAALRRTVTHNQRKLKHCENLRRCR